MNHQIMQLDVAIPTYQRAGELSSLLTSLLRQARYARHHGFQIRLIISDNGGSVSRELEEMLVNEDHIEFELARQTENIGYDANVAWLLSRARGDHILLVSDDDLFADDSLGRICESLRASPKSLHIFENELYGQSGVSADGQFFDLISNRGNVESLYLRDMRWKNFEMYGGLTGLCFPTSLLPNFPSKSLIGSNWIQLALFLWLAEQGHEITVNRGSFFLYRSGNKAARWGKLGVHLGIWSIYASMNGRVYPFAKFGRRKYFRLLFGEGLRANMGAIDVMDCFSILRARAKVVGVGRCLMVGAAIAVLWCLPGIPRGQEP